MQNKVLLTGFNSRTNDFSTSKILLEKVNIYDKFLFTNNFETINSEVKEILKKDYEYIIMFGWKPTIKCLSIEMSGTISNETLVTNFPLNIILEPLIENNISYKISQKPGNSYCNYSYYSVLKQIKENNLPTKAIFIHIPHKNNFIDMERVINLLNKEII